MALNFQGRAYPGAKQVKTMRMDEENDMDDDEDFDDDWEDEDDEEED
ncbi:MAG: hypothetical protein WC506_04040 [Candidatus Micrarchaeia archaeon]